MRSYSSEEIGKLAQDLGVLDSLGEDVVNARGIFPKVEYIFYLKFYHLFLIEFL